MLNLFSEYRLIGHHLFSSFPQQIQTIIDVSKVSTVAVVQREERDLWRRSSILSGSLVFSVCTHIFARIESNHGSLTIKHSVPQVLCETCLVHEYTRTRGWHSQKNKQPHTLVLVHCECLLVYDWPVCNV